jgi:hypothetical protein
MATDREWVRASEIGQWVYCQRAWWQTLADGAVTHAAHGADVRRAQRLQRAGLWLLLAALLALLALLAVQGFFR